MRNPRNYFVTPTLLFYFTCVLAVCASPAFAQSVPLAQHVVLVVEENTLIQQGVFPPV